MNPALELWLILGGSLLIVFAALHDDGTEEEEREQPGAAEDAQGQGEKA